MGVKDVGCEGRAGIRKKDSNKLFFIISLFYYLLKQSFLLKMKLYFFLCSLSKQSNEFYVR